MIDQVYEVVDKVCDSLGMPLWRHEYGSMAQREYVGAFRGLLLGLKDWVCVSLGMRAGIGEREYGITAQGEYLGGFRWLLLRMGVRLWIELVCGASWAGYRALDRYVTYPYQKPYRKVAWYLLNTHVSPEERHVVPQHQWYRCLHWESHGQRDPIPFGELEPGMSLARAGRRSQFRSRL